MTLILQIKAETQHEKVNLLESLSSKWQVIQTQAIRFYAHTELAR